MQTNDESRPRSDRPVFDSTDTQFVADLGEETAKEMRSHLPTVPMPKGSDRSLPSRIDLLEGVDTSKSREEDRVRGDDAHGGRTTADDRELGAESLSGDS